MSMFDNASNVYIQDGRFNVISGGQGHRYSAMALLIKNAVLGALHNAKERYDPPKCHQDTRVALLDSIRSWLRDPERKPIMWLSGPAGAGKSAIMQTLAEAWEEDDILGASFFFSRTAAGRNVKDPLVATIAYQLASSVAGMRSRIEDAVLRDAGIFEKSLRAQMDRLVIRPLKGMTGSSTITPMVIVIDGLDECATEDAQRDILETIEFVCNQYLPISFLISSRPERQLRESFGKVALSALTARVILDDSQNPNRDIECFLRYRFSEIRSDHRITDESWPSNDTIGTLVEKSSGQFVYASTVVKYVATPRKDPRRSLEVIMGIQVSKQDNDLPFKDLDALYMFILDNVLHESAETVNAALTVLIFLTQKMMAQASDKFTNFSPDFLDEFLLLDRGQIDYHLADMHSLLDIPPFERRGELPIRILHASLSDFLTDPIRSQSYYIDNSKAWLFLAQQSLSLVFVNLSDKLPTCFVGDTLGFTFRICFIWAPCAANLRRGVQLAMGGDTDGYTKYITSLQLTSKALPRTREIAEIINRTFNIVESIEQYLKRCDTPTPISSNSRLGSHSPFGQHSLPRPRELATTRSLEGETEREEVIESKRSLTPEPHGAIAKDKSRPSKFHRWKARIFQKWG